MSSCQALWCWPCPLAAPGLREPRGPLLQTGLRQGAGGVGRGVPTGAQAGLFLKDPPPAPPRPPPLPPQLLNSTPLLCCHLLPGLPILPLTLAPQWAHPRCSRGANEPEWIPDQGSVTTQGRETIRSPHRGPRAMKCKAWHRVLQKCS